MLTKFGAARDAPQAQWAHRYTGRVERINRFIDELGAKGDAGHPPYIPPMCGGADALALSISRDPGPKAGGTTGSGFSLDRERRPQRRADGPVPR